MDIKSANRTYVTSDVPLFYYSVKNFSPATVLNMVNVAESIPENNPNFNLHEQLLPTVSGGSEYLLPLRFRSLPARSLIVTDQATQSKHVEYAVPLFYQYQFMYDHYTPEPGFPEGFITVRKNNENTLSTDTYKLEYSDLPVSSGRHTRSGANKLINDSMEDGFTAGLANNWLQFGTGTMNQSSDGYEGSYSQECVSTDNLRLYQDAPKFVAGRTYRYSCWIKITSALNRTVRIRDNSESPVTVATDTTSVVGDWHQIVGYRTATVGGSHGIRIGQNQSGATGTYLIDKVEVVEVLSLIHI